MFRCELYAAVLNASVPEYRREWRDGSRSGHRNSSMGSRDGTGRDADLPIRPGTAQNTSLANPETLWDKLGSRGDRFLQRFLRSFPAFPHARVRAAERERELAGRP